MKNKKILALIIVVALVVGGFASWYAYDTYDTSYRVARAIVESEKVESFDREEFIWRRYDEVKNSFIFEKTLNSYLQNVVERGEDFDMEFGSRLKRLCISANILEKLGYEREGTKEVLFEAIKTAAEIRTRKHGMAWTIEAMESISEMKYYCSAEDVLSGEFIKATMTEAKEKALASADPVLLSDYVKDVSLVVEALPYINPKDLISDKEVHSFLEKNAEKAIVESGKGGYYDSKEDTINSGATAIQSSVVSSRTHYGDFRVGYTSETMYRPTGEEWEDSMLSKYDKEESSVYYKDELYSKQSGWFLNFAVNWAPQDCEVYVYDTGEDKSIVIVSSDYIVWQTPWKVVYYNSEIAERTYY